MSHNLKEQLWLHLWPFPDRHTIICCLFYSWLYSAWMLGSEFSESPLLVLQLWRVEEGQQKWKREDGRHRWWRWRVLVSFRTVLPPSEQSKKESVFWRISDPSFLFLWPPTGWRLMTSSLTSQTSSSVVSSTHLTWVSTKPGRRWSSVAPGGAMTNRFATELVAAPTTNTPTFRIHRFWLPFIYFQCRGFSDSVSVS